MATSGSYNWTINRDETILLAFQLINVYDNDSTTSSISTGDLAMAVKVLNGLLKMWANDGILVTKRRKGYLFTAIDQAGYGLGSASGANHNTNTLVATTIISNTASTSTVLPLTSTTGMTAGDFIGIELTAGTRQWTTIVSVDTTTQVTITTGLTGAAAAGNTVFTYTSKINRPLDILYGTNIDYSTTSLTETQIDMISHDQYYKLPAKTTDGLPNQMYYNKQEIGANPYYSNLYLYPVPSDVKKIVTFTYLDSIQDLDSSTDDIDLPQEALYPLAFNLACELGYFYGKFSELEKIKPRADELYDKIRRSLSDPEDMIVRLKTSRGQ
jgi:hypothetical protein